LSFTRPVRPTGKRRLARPPPDRPDAGRLTEQSALAVYRTTIGSLKVHTGDDNYRRIASLLLSARACHRALGTPDEFTRYVAALRVEQKRKRNLMKILTQNGL
jgi:hypothetical protein